MFQVHRQQTNTFVKRKNWFVLLNQYIVELFFYQERFSFLFASSRKMTCCESLLVSSDRGERIVIVMQVFKRACLESKFLIIRRPHQNVRLKF